MRKRTAGFAILFAEKDTMELDPFAGKTVLLILETMVHIVPNLLLMVEAPAQQKSVTTARSMAFCGIQFAVMVITMQDAASALQTASMG